MQRIHFWTGRFWDTLSVWVKPALFVVLLVTFLTPHLALAQADQAAEVAATAGLSDTSLTTIIGSIINVFLGLLGVIFLILIIYSGFLWMTAAGDEGKVDKAKQILINATVGLVITLASFAIASFIINALSNATGTGGGTASDNQPSIERLSGSLGGGALRDHYPERNAVDVPRNVRIFVTFRDAMDISSFITGYDTAGTPEDVSDDSGATAINTDRIKIFKSEDGRDAVLADVRVSFSDDLTTFIFDPDVYLGSATADTSYTVYLDDAILDVDGQAVLNNGGYEWSFEVGTSIDVDPPTVTSVTPVAGGTYARNIAVQVTFDEAIDPTSATGVREATSGFSNITTSSATGIATGTYEISNGYKTVTFTSSEACGTNSCNETIYCLAGNSLIGVDVKAATPGSEPPQVESYPYDGIVDASANALDGNNDGVAGDGYSWDFSTSNDISLAGPILEEVTPAVLGEDVSLDQPVEATFNSVLMSSTVNNDTIALTNTETSSGTSHELWYRFDATTLDASGNAVTSTSQMPVKTRVTIDHGVFLESIDPLSYLYGVTIDQGVRNEYQNCYRPAEGPDAAGGMCGTTISLPYCCNGSPSSGACTLF